MVRDGVNEWVIGVKVEGVEGRVTLQWRNDDDIMMEGRSEQP